MGLLKAPAINIGDTAEAVLRKEVDFRKVNPDPKIGSRSG
jgi:hypothetical protein